MLSSIALNLHGARSALWKTLGYQHLDIKIRLVYSVQCTDIPTVAAAAAAAADWPNVAPYLMSFAAYFTVPSWRTNIHISTLATGRIHSLQGCCSEDIVPVHL